VFFSCLYKQLIIVGDVRYDVNGEWVSYFRDGKGYTFYTMEE
jgi:hypothetical protein